ncbi:unnamed protein product [Amoebophrya sp. A120]|nr:unnamed protein product [Amoebophrya sp. A120]|eukprot:GSA120T00005235001.1
MPADTEHTRALLSSAPSLEKGSTALHAAAISGDLALMESLLRRHADLLDSPNSSGLTPLSVAVSSGNLEMVELLLTNGAKLGVQTSFGMSILEVAAQKAPEIEMFLRKTAEARKTELAQKLAEAQELYYRIDAELQDLHKLTDSSPPTAVGAVVNHSISPQEEQEQPANDEQEVDEDASAEQGGSDAAGAKETVPGEDVVRATSANKPAEPATAPAPAAEKSLPIGPKDHYYVRYANEIQSCITALADARQYWSPVFVGNFFGSAFAQEVKPSKLSSRDSSSAPNSTKKAKRKFNEIRVAEADLSLQSAVHRLMTMAADRKAHLDHTQALELPLKEVDVYTKTGVAVESGSSEEENIATDVMARVMAKEIPVVKDDPYQVSADGHLLSAGKEINYWESLVFPDQKKYTEPSESDTDRTVRGDWFGNPMAVVKDIFVVGRRFITSEVFTTSVKLLKKEKAVPPGTVLGFLSGEYCRKQVYDAQNASESGYFFAPGTYAVQKLCADRSVAAERLFLLLDSPEVNPLNAIGDVTGDPFRLLERQPDTVTDSTQSPKSRARTVLAQMEQEEKLMKPGGRPNVEIVEVLVRGVPVPFVRALSQIRPDEELVLDRTTMWLGYAASLRRMRLLRSTVSAFVTRVGD